MDDVRGDFLRPPHGTTPAALQLLRKIFPVFSIKYIVRWTSV